MKDFYSTRFFAKDMHTMLGFDSIQGYLEMAHWYHKGNIKFADNHNNKDEHWSIIFILNQLEDEGYIKTEWIEYKNDENEDYLELKQISLTTSGHKLLDELREKSKRGQFKKRIVNIAWTVITTIVTTLIVLKLKGI
jgi:hypothetical protein